MIQEQYHIYKEYKGTGDITSLISKCLNRIDTSLTYIKFNIFYIADGDIDFQNFKSLFVEKLNNRWKTNINKPLLNFIGQTPLCEDLVIEAVALTDYHLDLEYHNQKPLSYVLATNGKQSNLYTTYESEKSHAEIDHESISAMESLQEIIETNGFMIHDIKRQWNYIEAITECPFEEQNYQLFNNQRSDFFKKDQWNLGYPSATGIGSQYGGLLIDSFAVKGDVKEVTINNPLQIKAHEYSKEVLVGEHRKKTPKFERAKFMHDQDSGMLYISGTAAIRGEESVANKGIVEQTKITLENVQKLMNNPEIIRFKKENNIQETCLSARAYLKNKDDISQAQELCTDFFGDQIIFVQGDVCRDDLLIELEAIYSYQ